MREIREKTIEVLAGITHGMMERDEVMALCLLSAMAGESIFLLGLPGVGKSMMARRLKTAFEDASVFEYLMSRFSTPDEIFGPVSISMLKDEDRYERITSGFLPDADVVFLDEIWKAGPAIQNALLTVLNEKVFLNGNIEIHLPLKGLVAASNELPAKDEGLEALWDRFLIRYVVEPIEDSQNFKRLLLLDSGKDYRRVFKPFKKTEFEEIRRRSHEVEVAEDILDCIADLHGRMRSKEKAVDPDTGEIPEGNARFYISDRRWRKCVGVLKTSACLNGRGKVDFSDLLLFSHMLWNEDSSVEEIRSVVAEAVVSALFKRILDVSKSSKRHVEHRKGKDSAFYSPDGKTYLVDCDGSPLTIRKEDYEMLRQDPQGVYFASEMTDGTLIFSGGGQFSIKFQKEGVLNINGFSFHIQSDTERELGMGFISETQNTFDTVMNSFFTDIESNVFTSRSQTFLAIQAVAALYRKRFMLMSRR